jgi:hypothetical protein
MGKLAPKLVSSPPQRSLERQRLADAQASVKSAHASLLKVREAIERHREKVETPAENALAAAEEALAKLKSRGETALLAARFLGDDAEASSMEDAKKAVDDATAAVEEADKTRVGLFAREREAQTAVESAELSLRAAFLAAASAAPEIAALCRRYEALRREIVALGRIMKITEVFHGDYRWNTAWVFNDAFYNDLPTGELDAWTSALARLREDADAALPDVDPRS